MNLKTQEILNPKATYQSAMKSACDKIAPLWPLESFVAVNPYMGFSNKKFGEAAAELEHLSGIQMTMPLKFYLTKWDQGKILKEDLETTLMDYGYQMDAPEFIQQLDTDSSEEWAQNPIAVVDFASGVSETDWNRFMVTRISNWIASYHDKGQAYWKASFEDVDLFQSWKTEASIDRTPDFTGLKMFRKQVANLPDNVTDAVAQALEMLEVSKSEDLSIYFNRLLRIMGGWSAYLAYLDWEEKLDGKEGKHLAEFLSILVCWEACFLKSLDNSEIEIKWRSNLNLFNKDTSSSPIQQELVSKLILQDAFDKALQRELITKFKNKKTSPLSPKLKAQAVFCIDVRSEVFRRNLEHVDPQIETIGFAGFFGFPVNIVHLGGKNTEAQYPALIKPSITIRESLTNEREIRKAGLGKEIKISVHKIWKSFKSGAMTCFGFVSPLGLSYLPKIFSSTFGWATSGSNPNKYGLTKEQYENRTVDLNATSFEGRTIGIPLEQQVELARNALVSMSMTDNFGKFFLFVGHGSSSTNNPYATGLDCGACGGHSGEANAKVAATILNDPQVREGLKEHGIEIPEETIFLACLHDTTTDEVTIFNKSQVPPTDENELVHLIKSLEQAGQLTRAERSLRMNIDPGQDIHKQIKQNVSDWSQVRPEWGLAGCSTFVIAQRSHTAGVDLQGRSFLHSYDWTKDKDFKVLEQIMTAPMVVSSWINLQYYASAVDNKNLGSGNKTLHNVTSGIGVIEGAVGDIRTGLPWQSVHDGNDYQHDPNRLTVIIEAPIEAINNVLKKHESLTNLFDNGWIYLMAMDSKGEISYRYQGQLGWYGIE
ncbi:MAG: YbcC family protein [Bacteroidota bacterium]